MKNITGVLTTLFISFVLILASIPDAEARRFGAGRSFGGKSSYGAPFKRSNKSLAQRTANQKKAHKQNQSARQQMSRRGGLMGMLGGLALGGLLGAMFFGGAFEGLNFMDILLFGGLAYFLFKMFASKANGRRQTAYSKDSYHSQQDDYLSGTEPAQQAYSVSPKKSSAAFDTDILFDKGAVPSNKDNQQFTDTEFEEVNIPAGFDEADFLTGAKGAYIMLQKAWDNVDLAEIRGLTTDKVFAEIQQQLKENPEQNQTDVLKVESELLSIRELETDLEAIVLFDSIIRENVNEQAIQIKEIWHFIKPKNSLQPKWYLDGIQQLEQ